MSLRTDLLPVVDELRALAGPSGFDVRPVRVTIRTRVWSGGRAGLGTPTDTDLVLPQIYKVRELKSQEVAGSGGRYELGDVKVGPITPAYTGGGYSRAQLAPEGANGTEVAYLLSGAMAGEYNRISVETDRAFGYYLVLRRSRRTA